MGWINSNKRQRLYTLDGRCCAYCGDSEADGAMLSLDHILARNLGGDNRATNLITACLSCNSAKQDLTVRGWMAYLRAKGVDTTGMAARVRALAARHARIEKRAKVGQAYAEVMINYLRSL